MVEFEMKYSKCITCIIIFTESCRNLLNIAKICLHIWNNNAPVLVKYRKFIMRSDFIIKNIILFKTTHWTLSCVESE